MTLAVAVAVPEGLALGADSRMTYGNPRGWPRTASDYGFKVFEVTNRVAAATFGWAYLNGKNMSSLIEELKISVLVQKKLTLVDDVVPEMLGFFQQQYDSHVKAGRDKPVQDGNHAFGFLVAGYDKQNVGKLFDAFVPGVANLRWTTDSPGAIWQGQYDPVTRLIKGWDPRLDLSQLPKDLRQKLEQGEYIILFQNMTLQDAVDFVIFLIRTTIDMHRFSDGIRSAPGDLPGVGGAIDIAVVTPREFRWIQRKGLQGERATMIQTLGGTDT
jgi:hypothetical protein